MNDDIGSHAGPKALRPWKLEYRCCSQWEIEREYLGIKMRFKIEVFAKKSVVPRIANRKRVPIWYN